MKVTLIPFDTTVEVPEEALVATNRAAELPNLTDVTAGLLSALEAPAGFPPLKRALTPDDRVVIVVDDRAPAQGPMISALLNHIGEAGIVPECITLLSSAGSRQDWVQDLPDIWQDVRTEIHDPADRRRLSYLASTRHGRRIYLNRTLIDADQTVVLAGCRFDPQFGYCGGAAPLFPALSDAETIQNIASTSALGVPARENSLLEAETEEVAWLLGVPFLIQVIAGAGDGVSSILGGSMGALAEGRRLWRNRWHVTVPRPAHTVVTTLLGDSARHDFYTLALAAASAARVVEPGGRIVVLTHATPELGDGMTQLRDTDNTAVAARRVQERRPPDQLAVQLWLEAANKATLYLLSGLADEVVEELFATPLQQAKQVQRLVDAAASCLFLPDADKILAEIE